MNIVYGGSFNPPTKAHKLIIDKLFQIFMPDNIIVVPVGNSYGKKGLIEFFHRLNMAKLLDNRVVTCGFENKEEYTGTYSLLNYLSDYYSDLYYVIGSDNLKKLDTWINYKQLLTDYKFIVFNRYGLDLSEIINEKYPEFKNHFVIVELNMDVSATDFRDNKNRDVITDEVYNYIVENNLYEVNKK